MWQAKDSTHPQEHENQRAPPPDLAKGDTDAEHGPERHLRDKTSGRTGAHRLSHLLSSNDPA
jgi:hypothetical protein